MILHYNFRLEWKLQNRSGGTTYIVKNFICTIKLIFFATI